MIKIENKEVYGFKTAIRGMRNSWNSWDKSDSYPGGIGPDDYKLMKELAKSGSSHAKYRRMIVVYADVTAPLYWWKEMDTYKVGTVCNSCSTMHTLASKEFVLDDFSHEHLTHFVSGGELFRDWIGDLEDLVDELNFARKLYLETKDKKYWWQIIQLLPSSYNQRRTLMLNYEVLAKIYKERKNHKLDEWVTFCEWIEGLPYSELITLKSPKSDTIDLEWTNGSIETE